MKKTPDSFLTLSYKNEWIQCNSESVKWRGKVFASVRGAKSAITRFINSARPSSESHTIGNLAVSWK